MCASAHAVALVKVSVPKFASGSVVQRLRQKDGASAIHSAEERSRRKAVVSVENASSVVTLRSVKVTVVPCVLICAAKSDQTSTMAGW